MSEVNIIFVLIIAVSCGVIFFLEDFFDDHFNMSVNASLIAGISIAYFFVLLMPEIAEKLPEPPFDLKLFEFLFVLIGFSFVHVSEKVILQRVESKSQTRVRKLIKMEKTLKAVEGNLENILNRELSKENMDMNALKELGRVLSELSQTEVDMKSQIARLEFKIEFKINKDLEELRGITDFFYHFLVGFILLNLLLIDLFDGILFFFFAFFRAIISNKEIITHKEVFETKIFSDIQEIKEKHSKTENKKMKFLLTSSVLIGVITGVIFDVLFNIDLELVFILYSFIAGVILYAIVREVIPEKEKGKPLYFMIGVIGFTVVIITVKFLEHTLF